MSRARLVVVLGYSNGSATGLHEICAARVRRAQQEARPDDVVLLSGWARGRSAAPEAALMAESWSGTSGQIVLDRDARSTFGNVAGAAALARSVGARDVLLVTSGWHARRASALARIALRGSGASVTVASTDERGSPGVRLREALCWAGVPFAALGWRKRRSARISTMEVNA